MTLELEKVKNELVATREKNGIYQTLEQHTSNEKEKI